MILKRIAIFTAIRGKEAWNFTSTGEKRRVPNPTAKRATDGPCCSQMISAVHRAGVRRRIAASRSLLYSGVADGGGDVVAAAGDESGEEVTRRGKVAGPGSGPDLGGILTERDVADQVNLVFDAPVAAGVGGDVLRWPCGG